MLPALRILEMYSILFLSVMWSSLYMIAALCSGNASVDEVFRVAYVRGTAGSSGQIFDGFHHFNATFADFLAALLSLRLRAEMLG